MASSTAAKGCGVCNEDFDDEQHCPRILPCSHCLCTDCIDKLIINNAKNCPYCRKGFNGTSAQVYGINTSLLELLKYISELEANTDELGNQPFVSYENAEDQIENALQSNSELSDNLLEVNRQIRNEILAKMNEMTENNDRTVKYLEGENRKLVSHLRVMKERQKQMQGKLDESNTDVLQTFKVFISKDEKTRQEIGKIVKKTKYQIKMIQEALSCSGEKYKDISPIPSLAAMTIREENARQITAENLYKMSDPVKHLVKEGKVFAVQQLKGKRRSAKLSISEDDKLCLHHLKMEPLPPDAYVVEHRDIMRLVDPSSRVTFLDLGFDFGSSHGIMYISLPLDTKLAKQFSILCTGEMGPTYAYTKESYHGSEHCRFGIYDGECGKALVSGLGEESDWEYKRPWLEGTVVGQSPFGQSHTRPEHLAVGSFKGEAYKMEDYLAQAAQFIILTQNHPGDVLKRSFGMVQKGLNILVKPESQRTTRLKALTILDCGIVLPCKQIQ